MSEVIEPESCDIHATDAGYVIVQFDDAPPIRLDAKAANKVGSAIQSEGYHILHHD